VPNTHRKQQGHALIGKLPDNATWKVLLKHGLHQGGQSVDTPPHVYGLGTDVDPRPAGGQNHRRENSLSRYNCANRPVRPTVVSGESVTSTASPPL